LIEARNRVQQSGQEKRVIEHMEPYRQLERAGIVGEEQRISWTDALHQSGS
jgi:hypothetical protein